VSKNLKKKNRRWELEAKINMDDLGVIFYIFKEKITFKNYKIKYNQSPEGK
jgi:hypothetical protein